MFIIAILIFLIYLFIKWLNKDSSTYQNSETTNKKAIIQTTLTDNKEEVVEPDYLIDEDGRKYRIETRIREIPRRTYIHGQLCAKYRGEADKTENKQYLTHKFFPFDIYEATIEVKPISEFACSCVNDSKHRCEGHHKEFEEHFILLQTIVFLQPYCLSLLFVSAMLKMKKFVLI